MSRDILLLLLSPTLILLLSVNKWKLRQEDSPLSFLGKTLIHVLGIIIDLNQEELSQ